ncbi:uncharacterized protein LOC120333673 [Styela clava]
MSVVLFIIATIVGYYLYDLYIQDLRQSEKDSNSSRSSSIVAENTCTIPGCNCQNNGGFFRSLFKSWNNNYHDPHALIHEKPSPFQFRAFEDRFKSLEDVTQAIKEAGLEECRLILGIDFTASNEWQGRSTNKGHSLHHVSSRSHIQNPYQHVISILNRTLLALMTPYGHDPYVNNTRMSVRKPAKLQCIHAYGFGDSLTKDKSTFSLNPSHVPCSSFDELQKFYKETVNRVTLDGPTSYAPIINKAIEIVEDTNKQFHILIIIADGQFVDEGPTAEAIVKASNHPLSIVVVGVGDGPWTMLQRFDDWLPQRKFDNFQFVDYNKVIKEFGGKHAETAVALHTLMEIPDQYKTVQELGFLERPLDVNDYMDEIQGYSKKIE